MWQAINVSVGCLIIQHINQIDGTYISLHMIFLSISFALFSCLLK